MPQTVLEFSPGERVRLTAAKDGNANDVSWRWVPPAGSSAPASTTNVLEWTTGANDEGVYDVEVTSPTAGDSPAYGVMLLKLPSAPVTDPDAAAVLWNVIEGRGGLVTQPVQDAYTRHVIRLKAKGLWDGGTGEVFCYFSGVTGDIYGRGKLLAQSSWIRRNAVVDNWDFFNMVDADHDPLDGLRGDGISKHGIMTRQKRLEGNSTWLVFTTEGPLREVRDNLVGYSAFRGGSFMHYGMASGNRNISGSAGGIGNFVASQVVSGIAGYGVSRSVPATINTASNAGPSMELDPYLDDGTPSPPNGPAVLAEATEISGPSSFSTSRIFLVWCRPNTMTPFTGQQMSDFIAEVRQYYYELQVARR